MAGRSIGGGGGGQIGPLGKQMRCLSHGEEETCSR